MEATMKQMYFLLQHHQHWLRKYSLELLMIQLQEFAKDAKDNHCLS